jgi:hypothetical protein
MKGTRKMTKKIALAGASMVLALHAGVYNVTPDVGEDRVESPLSVPMKRIGTLKPKSVNEINDSNWTLGCEVLDRDFANYEEYKDVLAALGMKTIRLQAGWAKCEKVKGVYDFSWLDRIIDHARSLGINILLETSYGNEIYEGGGSWDIAGGIPVSEEGLAAWDAWVNAITLHFKGRVRDWAMWNEPDIGHPVKTPEEIARFNVRTARIVKRNIPDARIAGLSLSRNDPGFLDACLKNMGEDVKLFHWIIYHGYADAPEASYASVEAQKKVLAKYNPAAILRQGENGCPSEMGMYFALSHIPWSENSQAKWDMRRMLGDLGHDVESCIFTICDYNHKGREVNLKGLLRANENKEVIAVKKSYYAVQNLTSVFDDTLSRVKDSTFGTKDMTLATYEYRKADGRPVFVFWTHTDEVLKKKRVKGMPYGAEYYVEYKRPGDSFETRPVMFRYAGAPLKEPVWVDLLTGRIYEFPKKKQLVHSAGITYIGVPAYDSPCLLTERSIVMP